MQRLFWHFYLFIFMVLLGAGWAVEQLWQQWQPQQDPPWLTSYSHQLSLTIQTPTEQWPQLISLPFTALPPDTIGWLPEEYQRLQQGDVIPLYEQNAVYFYALQQQQLWRFGPLPLTTDGDTTWFTLLFFVLLAIAVALWLWPVARDIRLLQQRLQRFAKDNTTELKLPAHSFIAPIADSFMQMSQQIKALVSLQREMTHAVSHELRTPIARLTFALEMAHQLPEAERHLMLQDVRELQQLVDEILDYARLESDQLPLQCQQVELNELIRNVQEKLAPLPGADIELQLPDHALIFADGHYLERAIQNVLVNAKRYARQKIRVSLQLEQQQWHIRIDDDGPGVPQEQWAELVKPFYRAEASRTKQGAGFGLGLAIVQRIVQWHRGSLQICDSGLGGACFILSLPQR